MGVIGGGLLVAVAAALWIAYLMPIWIRRRQYLATERNAVRLQQTLRILAETAETPEPVVIEANARQIALHQRALREQERTVRLEAQTTERLAIAERKAAAMAADAAAAAIEEAQAAAEARARSRVHAMTEPIEVVTGGAATAPVPAHVAARRVLRRRRALCSLLLLVGVLTAVAGLVALAFGATPLIAVAGGVVVAGAFAGLAALARVRTERPVAAPVAPPVAEPFEPVELPVDAESHEGWTPQPLPKPLTLSRGTIAATAMASIEAAAELQRLAAEAERARRIDELATPVPTIAPAATTPAAASVGRTTTAPEPVSPYAGMGVVGEPQRRFGDLDAVLQRRRKVG
ncbi:hypothetical protein [Agromyces aureus]|uniref:Large exoprotein n=1 Tax=Agromyces aureus TaxID=453304 RepID=A0A191WDS1_9MICO|nr:hypothetical protein [Agromyces aureus]ANJ26416.1 hypothetical protein ATC03_06460 [Agromyces aureus]